MADSEMMALNAQRTHEKQEAPSPDAPMKPGSPTQLRRAGWWHALKRAWAEFNEDHCTDGAAALTYYGIMALFPAFLGLTGLLGIVGDGPRTTNAMLDILKDMGAGDVVGPIADILNNIQRSGGSGFAVAVGILGAIWSASGYVGAFSRAMNTVYDVEEGRPIWKLRPTMFLLTLALLLSVSLIGLMLVVSGPVARSIGDAVGLGDTAVTVWNVAKWPVMVAVVIFVIDLLYYVTPNVKQPKFKWLSPGALLAFVAWALASIAFGFYVANFGSYNKTYGALAGVIVFLLWLWLTNVVLLLGAEFDAEVERARELQAGLAAESSLQLPPKDTSGLDKKAENRAKQVAASRRFRLTYGRKQGDGAGTEGGSLGRSQADGSSTVGGSTRA